MSLTRSIAHNTLIQIIGKILSTLLGLSAVAMMTRYLGKEQFGWYVTATGFLQFIGIISDFGFTVTISNLLAEPRFDRQSVLSTTFSWRVLTAALLQGLAPLLILFFPYRPEIKLAVTLTTVSFFAIALNQVFIGYYRERLQSLPIVIAEVLGRLVLVGGVAICVVTKQGFLPIMGVITLASVLGTLYLWRKIGTLHWEFNPAISRALFHKMWPTALAVMCNAVYLQGDRVILPLYVPQATVGLYGAAYRVLDIVIQVAAIVMGLVMPLITHAWSRGHHEEFKKRYQLAFDLLALLLIPCVAGLMILAEPTMRFIAGASFSGAGAILKWLSISIFGTCFGMIFGHIALAIDRQRAALWIYASDAALSLIGYFIFIPRFGFYGAIGVTIFSELYAGLGLTLLTLYYSGVRPRLTAFCKIVLASVGMAAILRLLPSAPLPLAVILGATVYLFFIFLLRVISPATLQEIIQTKQFATEAEV